MIPAHRLAIGICSAVILLLWLARITDDEIERIEIRGDA